MKSTEADTAKAFATQFLGKLVPKGEGVKEDEKLCLWNPLFIVLWFIPFLGVWVGSALIAINWTAMGKKRWAIWAWGYLLLDLVVWYFVVPDDLHVLVSIIGGFALWLVLVALPQIWFVQTYYPTSYEKRHWLVPIGLGLIIGFTLPKALSHLDEWLGSLDSTTSSQLDVIAQEQKPARELTVEEVVQLKSGMVVPIEITWEETSWLIFSTEMKSSGSAVMFCTSGNEIVFITNRHVVETPVAAKNITRHIVDGKKIYTFDVVSSELAGVDLALIRLTVPERFDEQCIPYVPLDQVAVGQECVAIGNTLGRGISVTTGIVSKIDVLEGQTRIRTSAPISPGNSGGALFRRKDGALIGITSSSITRDRAQNVNFAIPIECIGQLKLINPAAQ